MQEKLWVYLKLAFRPYFCYITNDMKKIKEILIKLNDWKFIILITLILGGAFYWYSYRPYHITKLCIASAQDWAKGIRGDQTDSRYYFWFCQKKYGLVE
jgi:hypothetical protein